MIVIQKCQKLFLCQITSMKVENIKLLDTEEKTMDV